MKLNRMMFKTAICRS